MTTKQRDVFITFCRELPPTSLRSFFSRAGLGLLERAEVSRPGHTSEATFLYKVLANKKEPLKYLQTQMCEHLSEHWDEEQNEDLRKLCLTLKRQTAIDNLRNHDLESLLASTQVDLSSLMELLDKDVTELAKMSEADLQQRCDDANLPSRPQTVLVLARTLLQKKTEGNDKSQAISFADLLAQASGPKPDVASLCRKVEAELKLDAIDITSCCGAGGRCERFSRAWCCLANLDVDRYHALRSDEAEFLRKMQFWRVYVCCPFSPSVHSFMKSTSGHGRGTDERSRKGNRQAVTICVCFVVTQSPLFSPSSLPPSLSLSQVPQEAEGRARKADRSESEADGFQC